MKKKYGFLIHLLLSIICFLAFLQSNAQARHPNILWIVCEDISPFLGAYGNCELKTPNIDQLDREGVRYTRAYTTAGVCAPSRSAIITGMYQTSIGTQHMRTIGDPKYQPVPSYSAVIPDYVKCFPEYLRMAGYYCTNNMKQDYQFVAPVTAWDDNGPTASFRNRPSGKPFFAVFNFAITHESMLFSRKDSFRVAPESLSVPPLFPLTETVHKDIARLYTNIEIMDQQVGELLDSLKKDGLYDNTIIFFYSDHGGALPWMKREILERGTHIPLIIRFPGAKNAGITNDELVSSVDFAPTVLSLAGVPVPAYMQGRAFLGKEKSTTSRKYVYAARDRMDTEYDRVRMVRDKQFRYLYNYMPEKPYYQDIKFRLGIPMMREILELKNAGKLDTVQMSWFHNKPVEELYDVENDPWELNNLATDPKFHDKLIELRNAFQAWTKKYGDLGGIPEREMIRQMWNGMEVPPATTQPVILNDGSGVRITCDTKGASIGYRIIKSGDTSETGNRAMTSWDFVSLMGGKKNGDLMPVAPAWEVYNGDTILLSKGDILVVNAMRIGFTPSEIRYRDGTILSEK